MRIFILLSFLLITTVCAFGQTTASSKTERREARRAERAATRPPTLEERTKARRAKRKYLKGLPKKQIHTLKNGALLVRLHTKQQSIDALRKDGNTQKANELETDQHAYNIKIVQGFKKNFTFCPVYFFFSDYSKSVLEKKWNEVVFVSDSLVADTSIHFNSDQFLTAEFGIIEQDTATYAPRKLDAADETKGNRVSTYTGGASMGFEALLVKSDLFIQLRRPFPFYVRTYDSLPSERRPQDVIKVLNQNLFDFYKKNE